MNWGILLAEIGAFLAIAFTCLGSSIGVGIAGQAASGVSAEQPEKSSQLLVLELLPGSQGIYGFVIAIMIMSGAGIMGGTPITSTNAGLQYLFASLPIALGGLVSAVYQGKVAVSAIALYAKRGNGFSNAMMYTLMVETFALLSLLISFFLVSNVK